MNEITKVGFDYEMIANKITRKEVKHHETEIKKCFTEAHCKLINAGIHLANVKNLLEHGLFMDWVNQVFGMEYRTAKRYMEVAENFPIIDNLSIMNFQKSALYALAAPSIPEEAREEAIEIAQAGEIVTHAKAKEIVAKHTPPKPELNQPSGRVNRIPEVDHTDTAFPEDPQIDAPPEEDDDDDIFDDATKPVITKDTITPNATPLKPERPESDLTDAEWLMTIPTFRYMVTNNIPAIILRNDLLSWRTLDQLGTFNKLKMAVGKSFKTGSTWTLFQARMQNAIVKHPKHWGGCVKCRAHGCAECRFTGADVSGGLTLEQLEGK